MLLTADMTVGAALIEMTTAFTRQGLQTPDLDARFLLQGVLQIDATAVFLKRETRLGFWAGELTNAVQRRLAHEPVSRILGWRDFYGRRFAITPDVLDPRADTEAVIDLALTIAGEKGWRDHPIQIADIGTGSGILACTLLAELPTATALATDVSAAAMAVARRNADHLGVSDRLTTLVGRGLADGRQTAVISGSGAADQNLSAGFDLIVSNPPYIPTSALADLASDVADFDPIVALDGGADGLSIYREICSNVIELQRKTTIIFEVGKDQGADVAAVFERHLAAAPRFGRDLGGHIRVVALEIHCET